MTVLTLAGKPINWNKPPKATAKVMWSQRTTGGKAVIGSFRTICALDERNRLAIKRFGRGMSIYQGPYNTTIRASAGSHDLDAALDHWIFGVPGRTQETFHRVNGGGGYFRYPAQGFDDHIHEFVLPPYRAGVEPSRRYQFWGFKVGTLIDGGYSTRGRKVSSSQIGDYYSKPMRDGLSGHNLDRGYKPPNIDATIFVLTDYIARQRALQPGAKPQPIKPAAKAPKRAPAAWSKFVHLDSDGYMDYEAAIRSKAGRERGVDVDVQVDADGNLWALHWEDMSKNGLFAKGYSAHVKIGTLHSAEVAKFVSRNGKRAKRLLPLLIIAHDVGTRIEAELKTLVPASKVRLFMANAKVRALSKRGDLQWKTLAALAGASGRMKQVSLGGGVTLLSFTKYKGRGIPKAAWPYIDYTRGVTKWA